MVPSWSSFVALLAAPITVTVRGTVRVDDGETAATEQVTFAPPDSWRIADSDGALRYLANAVGHFQYPPGGGRVACFQPRQPNVVFSGGMAAPGLVLSRDLRDPDDDDFTRPIGDVEETTYLGRPAWRVLLAPPARKPHPMVQILDVSTGLTLAMQTADGAVLLGFSDLETDIEIPVDVFDQPR